MSLIGPSMSSTQGLVSGAHGTGSCIQDRSLDTSQYSPLVGSTHGTLGSSCHPGVSFLYLGKY